MLCSALLCSQAPEFAQQYRQRLGGAVDELRTVVDDFDQDAGKQNLSREQALEKLTTAQQDFVQSRGVSMTKTIDRFTGLTQQQKQFNSVNPALRPIALFSTFDKTTLQGTWQDYQPALPLTLFGLLWTVMGGLFGWVTILLITLPFSSKKNQITRKQDPQL